VTESDRGAAGAPADSVDWDARYAGSDQVWSGNPNSALVAEVSEVTPGTSVDVGCGEGADAIWLAQRGWHVTAFDVSSTALARASNHIANAGVTVQVFHGGLLDFALTGAQFDLVNVQYPALLHEQGRSLAALLGLVAPGGALLFVHHADAELEEVRRAGFDPADYVLPRDAHAALSGDWDVQVYEERPRHVTTGAGAKHNLDLVLKARRNLPALYRDRAQLHRLSGTDDLDSGA
jgi:SAM-dependent methyltransferase